MFIKFKMIYNSISMLIMQNTGSGDANVMAVYKNTNSNVKFNINNTKITRQAIKFVKINGENRSHEEIRILCRLSCRVVRKCRIIESFSNAGNKGNA